MPRIFILILVAIFLCAKPALAAWWWPFGNNGIDYKIEVTGVDTPIQNWLADLQLTKPTETDPPQNLADLAQEAVTLSEKLRKALEAKGYYEAEIEPHTETGTEPPILHYNIKPGPQYKIAAVKIDWLDAALKPVDLATLTTQKGQPVDVVSVLKDADDLEKSLGRDACLLSLKVAPMLQLHSVTRNADVVFKISHGARANFGPTITTGNVDVKDSVVQRAVGWQQSDCFEAKKIESLRTNLIQNQLFSSVTVTPGTVTDAKGEVPITVAVKERVPRTIRTGIDYSTNEGAGVHANWEHRNFWGDAEKLTTEISIAELAQSLNGNLRVPGFLADNQTLSLLGNIKHEDTDAYTAYTVESGANIERRLSPHLNTGLGIGYTVTQTNDTQTGKNNYGLLSFPGFAEYDTRNNTLDPRRGIFGRVTITPYTETFGDGGRFLKTQATGQTYLSDRDLLWRPTLALRGSIGNISGGSGQDVPSDIRFYAGGGGSVRGYSYQALSPRVNGSPVGGNNLVEGAVELRLRFTPEIGAVAFMDAGNAYDDSLSTNEKALYYGAGTGIRYYSPMGPLRADIAFPLNGQDIGQKGMALYVSIGQAF